MATFTSFQDTLPDPNNRISRSGGSVNPVGTTAINSRLGPGFTSVKFTAKQPVMMNRTNSGRVITRTVAAHSWDIDISYNNLTREEFEPVFSFLMAKNGRLNPFFINLPQYLTSRDSAFVIALAGGSNVTVNESGGLPAGRTYMKASWPGSGTGNPAVGDMFTITDGNNSNHTKAYMVTRVETFDDSNLSLDSTSVTTTVTSAGGGVSLVAVASTAGLSVGDILSGPTGIDSPTRRITSISGNNIGLSSAFNFGLSGHAPVSVTFTGSETIPTTTTQIRLHFSPPLVAATSNSSVLDFTAPKIRVIQASDVTQYSLGTNGLYKFGLKVEEALP